MITFIELTMALHQRQRQSCKRRTLPQVLSHTVHLALTGRFPSNHWCGIEICKWYRGREAIWTFQSATQECRMHCGTEAYIEASLYMHCSRRAKAISRKHPRISFGILHHAQAWRDQVTRPRLPQKHRLASDIPCAKVLFQPLFHLSFAKTQTRFPIPPIT